MIFLYLSQVIFSDETYVDVCGSSSQYVRRASNEPIRLQHTTQHRPFLKRLMFWGAMSATGPVALVPVNGIMSAARYITILQENIIEFLENQPLANHFVFQHDNAPSHKAQSTTAFLNANAVDVLPWPPYSPDLSPIENMWAVVKRRIREQGCTSIEELSQRFAEIWSSPEMICMCRTLMDSMPRRIAMCIRNKGGYIKY